MNSVQSANTESPASELPLAIGPYQILMRLGAGGMAEVFLGLGRGEGGFERLVAIKRMRPELAGLPLYRDMFLDEARISARLHHGNIVQVNGVGRDQGQLYMVMEYVQGLGLERLFWHFKQNPGDPHKHLVICQVLARVCAGLGHAHDLRDARGRNMGIVHRDVSLQNVLVSFGGDVKLLDFGIVKAHKRLSQTQGEMLKGKLSYMPPEALQRRGVDRRSDLYGCGLVLHECLTGERLFRSSDARRTADRVLHAEVPPPGSRTPGVPAELDRICMRALARFPGDRYQDAGQLQQDLERLCMAAGFGPRQLQQFIQQTFAEERQQQRQKLRQARERIRDGIRRRRAARMTEMARTIPHLPACARADQQRRGRGDTRLQVEPHAESRPQRSELARTLHFASTRVVAPVELTAPDPPEDAPAAAAERPPPRARDWPLILLGCVLALLLQGCLWATAVTLHSSWAV